MCGRSKAGKLPFALASQISAPTLVSFTVSVVLAVKIVSVAIVTVR